MVQPSAALHYTVTRAGLAGFLLSGLLMSFLGAVLPVWGYHIQANALLVGTYFLTQFLGVMLSLTIGPRLLRKRGLSTPLALSCALAAAGMVELAFVAPPLHYLWRIAGLSLIGFSAGLLNLTLFHALHPAYDHDPAATINLGGAFFGLGCFLTALLVAFTYYTSHIWLIFLLLALPCAVGSILYARRSMPSDPVVAQPSARQVLSDFKNPAAVLFTLLLFFQFGNEWSIAGWLPLYVSQRFGFSPSTALLLLSLYWLALMLGRYVAQFLLPRVSHTRMLLGALVSPLFGSAALAFTDNLFGLITAVLFMGSGFSVIYPLVVEKIGHRFPYFHPGFFNGVFSIGITGALLAPATIGIYVHYWGLSVLVLVPLLGTLMVLLLHLLIVLETRLSGQPGA